MVFDRESFFRKREKGKGTPIYIIVWYRKAAEIPHSISFRIGMTPLPIYIIVWYSLLLYI